MKVTITEKVNKINALKTKIIDLELQIRAIEKETKEELSKLGDLVEELALYIKLNNYPKEIYSTFSIDIGEYDNYKHIKLKVVYNYGYTDIVGLTEQEFNRLENLLMSE